MATDAFQALRETAGRDETYEPGGGIVAHPRPMRGNGRYRVEEVGAQIAFLARNLEWRNDDPSAFIEAGDLDLAVRAVAGVGIWALMEGDWWTFRDEEAEAHDSPARVLRSLVRREHRPAKEPWACRLDNRKEVDRYPHPFTVMEKAKAAEDAVVAAEIIIEADAIRVLRRVTRAMNGGSAEERPRRRVANQAWLLGPCACGCGRRVEYGDPVFWLKGRVWCQGCEVAA